MPHVVGTLGILARLRKLECIGIETGSHRGVITCEECKQISILVLLPRCRVANVLNGKNN